LQFLAYLCSHKPSSIGPVRCGTVFFLPLLKLSPCTHHSTLTLQIIQSNNWKCPRLRRQYPQNTSIVYGWIWVTIDKEPGLFSFIMLKSMFLLKLRLFSLFCRLIWLFWTFNQSKCNGKTCHYHGDIVQKTWQLLYRLSLTYQMAGKQWNNPRRYKCIKT
jgi:hypothetical protein